jgi:hypothetical protein
MDLFFCNGYPSLVGYTLVSIVSNGIAAKQVQKQVYMVMNNCVRKPGSAIVASLLLYDAFALRCVGYTAVRFYPNTMLSLLVYYKYATSIT